MLAGILLVTGFVLHPAGEDATFGADPLWIPAHAALWAAFTIALVGWVGLYIAQASKAGVLGAWAFVVILLGTSLASWIFSSDVMYVPTIAVESPGLFGLIVTRGHTFTGIFSVVSWILGNILFGLSIVKAKVYKRWSGVLLVVGGPLIPSAYLTGLPVRVVAVGAFVIAVGQVWLGYELIRMGKRAADRVEA